VIRKHYRYISVPFLTKYPNRNSIISSLCHFLVKVDKFGFVHRGTTVCQNVENVDLFSYVWNMVQFFFWTLYRFFMHVVYWYQSSSAVNNWTATSHLDYSNKAPDDVRLLGSAECQENSYGSSLEWLEKAGSTSLQLLVGHHEEWPIISQPQCGSCHRADTGQTTLKVIGSKRSYALN